MGSMPIFDGSTDVNAWAYQMKAKLISKGYRSQLLDANLPGAAGADRDAWVLMQDKALGSIMTYLHPDISALFIAHLTPETLLTAIVTYYCPDQNQEIDKLENELISLTYDGTEPVAWAAKVRGIIAKLTTRGSAPTDRTVRNVVLKALEHEIEYKIRIEVIRQVSPNITLPDLWLAIGKLPYPIKREESAFAVLTSFNRDNMNKNNNNYQGAGRGNGANRGRGGAPVQRGRGRGDKHVPVPRPANQKYAPLTAAQKAQRKKDTEEGNCFRCHKSGHAAQDCEEGGDKRKVSTDGAKDDKSPKDGDDKGKGKANANAYSYFSQVVNNAPQEHPQKRPKECVVLPQNSADAAVAQRARAEIAAQEAQAARAAKAALEAKQSYTPPYSQETTLNAELALEWEKENGIATSTSMCQWWQIEPHTTTILVALEVNSIAKWGEQCVTPLPADTIDEKSVVITNDVDKSILSMESADQAFGCLKLDGGKVYHTIVVAQLVLKTLDKQLYDKMAKLESTMLELGDDLYTLRIHWIIWRELALYRALLSHYHQSYGKPGSKLTAIEDWLALAGVDRKGKRILAVDIKEGIRTLLADRTVRYNYTHGIAELVRCECINLKSKHQSFAWLTDPALAQLVGVSGEELLDHSTPSLEEAVVRITNKLFRRERVSLAQVHYMMEKLTPLPTDVFKGILGMQIHCDTSDDNNCTQGDTIDDSKFSGTAIVNQSNVMNDNKLTVKPREYLLVTTTKAKAEDDKLQWHSKEVADAIKSSDMSQVWVTDSGATKHMTGRKEWLSEMKPTVTAIKMGGGQIMPAIGVGKVSLTVINSAGEAADVTLNDVLYVPDLKVNLFSVIRTVMHGSATIVYEGKTMHLKPKGANGDTLAIGKFVNSEQLYVLDCSVNLPEVIDKCLAAREQGSNQYTKLCHHRFAHISASKMKIMHKTAEGVKQMLNMNPHECTICAETKLKRKAISKKKVAPAGKPLQIVSIDVVGPFPKSVRGYTVACTVTDSNTRRRWALLLKSKGHAFAAIEKWAIKIEARTGLKIQTFKCDRGGEFDSTEFHNWCDKRGYKLDRTAPHTPEQNGIAERYNGTIVPSMRAVMRHHGVPKDWWCFAMEHVNEVLNMIPTRAMDDRSSVYMWTGKLPDVSKLRVFGCLAYAHLDGIKLPKLAPRAIPCVYLGHVTDGDGYKLWNWSTDKTIVCRSVEFFEGQSAFQVPEAKDWMKNTDPELLWSPLSDDESGDEVDSDDESSVDSADDAPVANAMQAPAQQAAQQHAAAPQQPVQQQQAQQPQAPLQVAQPQAVQPPVVQPIVAGGVGGEGMNNPPHQDANNNNAGGNKKKKKGDVLPPVFKGQDAPTANVNKNAPGIGTSSLRQTSARLSSKRNENAFWSQVIDITKLTDSEYGLVIKLTGILPENMEKFKDALIAEMQAIEDCKVYEEVDRETGMHVIKVKWILKEKKATSLTPAKLKARLVAKGYTQTYGVNYEETYAPVARVASIRAVFAMCAAMGWDVDQLDVDNAFLNGDMDRDNVFIEQPPFFVDIDHPTRVWLLRKGLYGTKQGGYIWYKTFTGHLIKQVGLIDHASDPCLFTSVDENHKLNSISSIYVDDDIIGGPKDVVANIKAKISEKFAIKDLGLAKHVVGIQVEQLPEGTLLTQAAYTDEILQLTRQQDAYPLAIPMSQDDPSFTMTKSEQNMDNPVFELLGAQEHHFYRECIGKLMYLMVCTRPDIAFAVNFLARAVAAPERRHMNSVFKVARYLKGTRCLGIFYPRRQGDAPIVAELVGYVDAAFADCLESRKSTGGYLFMMNGLPLTWKSGRQTIVTTSTTEAEYVTMCDGAKEAVWLRNLFTDMDCIPCEPTVLYEDNNSCIALTENPLHHKRTKHIDVYYHYTRDMVENEVVVADKVDTTDQVADILTKPLGKVLFSKHLKSMNMRSTQVHAPK